MYHNIKANLTVALQKLAKSTQDTLRRVEFKQQYIPPSVV